MLEKGLNITVLGFEPDGTRTESEIIISHDELEMSPKGGQDTERDARVYDKMVDPVLTRGMGGVALETVAIGPEDATNVNFVFYGWGGNTRHPVAIHEAQTLAANNPDSLLVFTNNFGTGRSSMLPKVVTSAVRASGHYDGVGEYVASVVDKLTEGRSLSLMGHSLGARTATGTAAHLSNPAEALILNDPTGTRKMNLFEIAIKFGVIEGGHIGRYMKAGFDEKAAYLQKHGSIAKNAAVKGAKSGWQQQFLIDPSGLSKESFRGDFLKAARSVNKEIRIISPDLSALNDPDDITDIMATARGENSRAKMEQYILRDHTHSVVTIPQVLARLYKS